jgi:hypothetical protein
VSLGKNLTTSSCLAPFVFTVQVDHEIGMGLIHLGSHIHQAVRLEEGERINLIIWSKAQPFL